MAGSAAGLKLYEATDALEIVRDFLYEAEGELTPEIQELLDQAEGDFSSKVERVALFIREQAVLALAVKQEVTRLRARADRYERSAESLKGYLLRELERAAVPKVEGRFITTRIQKNPPAVVGEIDVMTLDGEWADLVRVVPEQFSLDRRAVLDRYKAGQPIPAGLSVEQTLGVRFS